jgi:hypothetical protein
MLHPQRTRRDVFRIGGGALALTALPRASLAQQTPPDVARGIVFWDRGETGQRRPDDPGISGVLVSDGRRVARTDAQGRYELPVDDDAVIFIIKPAGWISPLDPLTKLPRFYHIHDPLGTPAALGITAPGVEPTGALPESLDFPLRRNQESARFEVLMFADPQPSNTTELDFLRESFISPLAGSTAAFGLTLGDVMSDDLNLYHRYNCMLGQLGLPWWNLPGNHDLNYESAGQEHARETWKSVYGPPWHAFEYGEALFLMLDNVQWRRGEGYHGGFGERQLDFIKNVLSCTPKDKLIVACMHIPLISSEARPTVSFSGHMHTSEHYYLAAPEAGEPHHHQILAAVSGSWWSGPGDARGLPVAECVDGTPNGYYVLSVDGSDCSTRFVSRESSGMRVAMSRAGEDCATVFANVFEGGPRTRARLEIDGTCVEMTRVTRPDPLTQALYARHADAIKSWVQAVDCTHLWSAALPARASGFHKLTVVAADEQGREMRQSLIFEVA